MGILEYIISVGHWVFQVLQQLSATRSYPWGLYYDRSFTHSDLTCGYHGKSGLTNWLPKVELNCTTMVNKMLVSWLGVNLIGVGACLYKIRVFTNIQKKLFQGWVILIIQQQTPPLAMYLQWMTSSNYRPPSQSDVAITKFSWFCHDLDLIS